MKYLLFALFTTTIASSIATEIISSNHHPITTTNQRYTIYEGCGKSSKTCLGIPENCVPQRSCHAVTTLTLVDEKYIFEMQTGYNYPHFIATALSWDDQMGDDAVMECVRENGTIQMYASWTTVRPYNATRIPPDHLRLLNSSRIDGTIYCKIEHEPVIRVRGRTFDLTNGKHYLLLAAGHGLRNDSISFHNIGKAASNEVIDLRVKEEFPGASRLFIRLHGALMVIAWMGSGSVGILLARHFKETWEQWLVWHKMCSFTTWLLTIAGFIIIFLEVRGWSQVENPHAVLGVITTFICFLQPISALIQQEMTDKETRFFYWFHKISGEMSHIFASEYE